MKLTTEIPKDVLDETELFLDEVHDRCYKVKNPENHKSRISKKLNLELQGCVGS